MAEGSQNSRSGCVIAAITLLAAMVAGLFYLNRLKPTVDNPLQPADAAPDQTVVGPLALDWTPDGTVPWPAALPLARISAASYLSGDELQQTMLKWGLTRCDEIGNESMVALVASNDDVVVVAFRGTDDVDDWLINASMLSFAVPEGSIHQGFYQSMLGLRSRLLDSIDQQGGNLPGTARKKVWVVGHSLGGALALAFTYAGLADGSRAPDGLVTFGQPLLVDRGLAEYVNGRMQGRYLRFVHEADLVTRLLPAYAHCGTLVWFHDGDVVIEAPPPPAAMRMRAMMAEPDSAAPAPLTEEEFLALQQQLRDEQQAALRPGLRARTMIGGNTPWIADHQMTGYIHWLVKFSTQEDDDPELPADGL